MRYVYSMLMEENLSPVPSAQFTRKFPCKERRGAKALREEGIGAYKFICYNSWHKYNDYKIIPVEDGEYLCFLAMIKEI